MKKMLHSLFTGFLSLVTTCMIMAAPVAAVIYASELSKPVVAIESLGIAGETVAAVTAADNAEFQVTDKKIAQRLEKAAADEQRENRQVLSGLTLVK